MADEQPFRSTATPTELRHILPSDLNGNNDGNARDPPFSGGGACGASHTSHAGNPFLSVVHRLAASKSTSARVAACSLGPVLWSQSHLDFPRQLQLRGVVTRALHDVEVAVRKSTAAVLHEIAELALDRRAVPWLVARSTGSASSSTSSRRCCRTRTRGSGARRCCACRAWSRAS